MKNNATHTLHPADAFLQLLGAPVERPPLSGLGDQAALSRLIACGETVQRLKDRQWYTVNDPVWVEPLAQCSFTSLLVRLYNNASTGVLTAKNQQTVSWTIGVVQGTPAAIASGQMKDRLGAYLLQSQRLRPAMLPELYALMQREDRSLGWALLKTGLLTPQELLLAQQAQAQKCLQQALGESAGEAQFFECAAAADLQRVIDTPFLALLRQFFASAYQLDEARLRKLTEPVLTSAGPLTWLEPTARLERLLAPMHPSVMAHVRRNPNGATLQKAIAELDATARARALADTYFLVACGCLVASPGSAPIRLADLPPSAAAPDVDPLLSYRQQREALNRAKRALNRGQPQEAVTLLLGQNAASPDAPVEILAYLAIAEAAAASPQNALSHATEALTRQPQDALAQAAMYRALIAAGKPGPAITHHRHALALSQNSAAWQAEVRAALIVGENQAAQQERYQPPDGRSAFFWLGVGAVFLSLFLAANGLKLGVREYFYTWDEPFFYFRRLTLLLAGIGGWCAWRRQRPAALVAALPWRLQGQWIWQILLYGVVVGALSPAQRVAGGLVSVSVLCVLHVVAEEIFFRGLVTTLLADALHNPLLTALCSGLVYGVYHLTYYSFWAQSTASACFFYIGLIAAFAGVPYAWLVAKTKTLTAPLLCHAVVSLVMMWLSVLRMQS